MNVCSKGWQQRRQGRQSKAGEESVAFLNLADDTAAVSGATETISGNLNPLIQASVAEYICCAMLHCACSPPLQLLKFLVL